MFKNITNGPEIYHDARLVFENRKANFESDYCEELFTQIAERSEPDLFEEVYPTKWLYNQFVEESHKEWHRMQSGEGTAKMNFLNYLVQDIERKYPEVNE